MDLRLTRRALADLDLDPPAHAGRSATELTDRHPLIAAFVERRGQSPEGQEAIQLPASRATVYSLHAGRWRGLTWWEEDLGIVWLLGAGYHRSGERSDAYAALKRRDETDDLFPADQDYLDLEPDPTPYVEAVARDAPALLARAREAPGVEVHGELGGVLEVSLVALVVDEADQHLEEIWVGFSMPPRGPMPPHPDSSSPSPRSFLKRNPRNSAMEASSHAPEATGAGRSWSAGSCEDRSVPNAGGQDSFGPTRTESARQGAFAIEAHGVERAGTLDERGMCGARLISGPTAAYRTGTTPSTVRSRLATVRRMARSSRRLRGADNAARVSVLAPGGGAGSSTPNAGGQVVSADDKFDDTGPDPVVQGHGEGQERPQVEETAGVAPEPAAKPVEHVRQLGGHGRRAAPRGRPSHEHKGTHEDVETCPTHEGRGPSPIKDPPECRHP